MKAQKIKENETGNSESDDENDDGNGDESDDGMLGNINVSVKNTIKNNNKDNAITETPVKKNNVLMKKSISEIKNKETDKEPVGKTIEKEVYLESLTNRIDNGYCYINHEREFIKCDQDIYKIGKTQFTANKRLKQYPKGTIQKIKKNMNNYTECENELIEQFDKLFTQRSDIGREYYEGDYEKMEDAFIKITRKYMGKIEWVKYKHKQIVKIKGKSKKSDVKIIKYLDGKYKCNLCKFSTDSKWNHSRHMIGMNHTLVDDFCNDILKKAIDQQPVIINNDSAVILLGKIADITNKYPSAIPLESMNYDNYLRNTNYTYDKEKPYKNLEKQFLEEVIRTNKNDTTHIILSQAIIKIYRNKLNPHEQSMWCTDVSRSKYVVMKENNKNTQWVNDPGGVYVIETIIKPLMDPLCDLLMDYHSGKYFNEYKRFFKKKYPDQENKYKADLEQHEYYQLEAYRLKNKITEKTLQKKILKYLTSFFAFTNI